MTGSQASFERPEFDDDDDDHVGLKDGFDWYMSPKDKGKYEEIYAANCDGHGDVTFDSLDPLYSSLDVPDTDVHSAWNLVNPNAATAIGKDATLAFLHVLNNRHEGYRIPRTVPASLRASFEKKQIDYQVDRAKPAQRWGANGNQETATGRKAKFGDTYLSRLGLGGASYKTSGTDFSSKATPDWEEVRLKKQLAELTSKMERIQGRAEEKRRNGGRRTNSKPALVKRELEQLLDYKRRDVRELELGEGSVKEGQNLKNVGEEIETVREQIEGLERHWKSREAVLEDIRTQIEAEKR